MFDYRALYEIQLQVSVDFLRVVQFRYYVLLPPGTNSFITPVLHGQPKIKADT